MKEHIIFNNAGQFKPIAPYSAPNASARERTHPDRFHMRSFPFQAGGGLPGRMPLPESQAMTVSNAKVPIIRMFHVHKRYGAKAALMDINLDIQRGELLFVSGPSGAGKSTLLKMIYRGEPVSEGQVLVDGMNLSRLGNKRIPMLRRLCGIIFQDYKLIPARTVFDNVALVLEANGTKRALIRKKVTSILRTVGMEDRQGSLPPSLSGGEQQRVAVARAVVGSPKIILADEPTGNLDAESAAVIFSFLQTIHRRGTTVVVASHAKELIDKAGGRVIHLRAGQLTADTPAVF